MKHFLSKTFFVVLALSISSCKQPEGSAPSETLNPVPATPSDPAPISADNSKEAQLEALATQFRADYSATWSNISLGFKPGTYMNGGGSGTVVGVCEVYSDGARKVWMNQEWWQLSTTSDILKKILFYHEMGHCYFNRSHDTRTYPNTRPYSIMYPYIDPVAYYYSGYIAYYLGELDGSIIGGSKMTLNRDYEPDMVRLMNSQPLSDESGEPTIIVSSKTYDDGSCDIE